MARAGLPVADINRITLHCGGNSQSISTAVGATIAEIREVYADIINIPPDLQARINGKIVDDSYVLQGGEEVDFNLPQGEKG